MNSKRLSILICLFSFFVGASQNSTLFKQATEHYNKGEYSKAIENYEKILKNGEHSAELYFNLGNSYYKLNEIGPSIYYYEKALLLKPNDNEVLSNLGYAQNMRLDAVEEIPKTDIAKAYSSFVNTLSFDQWAHLAVSFILLFVFAYLAYFFLRFAAKKRIAFIVSILFLISGVLSVAMAYLQYQEFKNDNPAIIYSQEVKINSEPNNNSEIVFVLHEGTKVNVLDQLNNWSKIKLAGGQTGWMPKDDLKLLKDF